MHHGTEEQFELYTRGKLNQPELIELEEHLLVCSSCVDRLDEVLQFSQAMRTASEMAPARKTRSWPVFSFGYALAAALALVVGIWVFEQPTLPPVATLQLTAVRGEMPSTTAAQELDLVLTDAPADAKLLRVQVVDAAGASEWDGPAGPTVKVHKSLKTGTYFVRLYTQRGQMLHEYGFKIRAD